MYLPAKHSGNDARGVSNTLQNDFRGNKGGWQVWGRRCSPLAAIRIAYCYSFEGIGISSAFMNEWMVEDLRLHKYLHLHNSVYLLVA